MKTTSEVAKIIGVGEPTVRRWLDRGLLQGTKSVGTGRGSCQIDEDSIERFLTAYPIYRIPADDRLTLNEVCGVLGLARNQRGHDILSKMSLNIFYGPEQELVRGYVSRKNLLAHIERAWGAADRPRCLERLTLLRQAPRPNLAVLRPLLNPPAGYAPVEVVNQTIRRQMVLRVRRGEAAKLLDHVVCKRVHNEGELDLNGFQLRSLQ